jgi:purine-binding chemotaxis protein CheW
MGASETSNINHYLTFSLGEECYALPIDYVLEMTQYTPPTPIRSSDAYFMGIMHLREYILPIIDLRVFFNVGQPKYDQYTVIIILKIQNQVLGIVVDSVLDVVQITSEKRYQQPNFPTIIQNEYIQGFFDYQDKIGILLDIEKLILKNLNPQAAKTNNPENRVKKHGI